MKKSLFLLVFIILLFNTLFTQNVGIGTVSPTNTLHVVPTGGTDPLRVDGLKLFSTEKFFLVVDTLTGLVRHMPADSLITLLGDSIDTDIDSMKYVNDTLYLYEDNQVLTTLITSSLDTALVDSLIIAKSDTLYTLISDSLLNDTLWLDSLGKLINDNDWNTNINGTGLEAAAAGNNVASGQYAIAAGFQDSATAQYATISGGGYNKATASGATVGGGADNYATAIWSTVAGGQDNVTLNAYSFIGGGFNDTTQGDYAVVAGGIENKASSYGASILGGQANKATADYSTIGGGYLNNATGTHSFIGSGLSDTASGNYSVVSGGEQNKVIGNYGSIAGGRLNNANGTESFIGGGENNYTSGTDAATIGGFENRATGSYSLAAGYRDTAQGSYTLATGRENLVTGTYSSVSGYRNKVLSSYSHAGGRNNHISSSSYGFIHGLNDTLEGTIQGGFIAGENNTSRTTAGSTGRNAIFGADNKIITNDAGSASHTLSIFGGIGNLITGTTGIGSTIVGGSDNTIDATSSFPGSAMIVGGTDNIITGLGGPSNLRSVILGGFNNSILGATDAINIGGEDNVISANATRAVTLGGIDNTATGLNTIAGGQTTTARTFLEVTLGRFNDLTNSPTGFTGTWNATHALFTIGNGANTLSRSNAFQVRKNGQTYAAGFNIVSDKNYKSNFSKIESPLQRVLKVNSYNYFFNDTYKPIYGDAMQTGFIAQEIQDIFPELVTEAQDKLAVNYTGLIPVLVEATKEQQEIIETQNKKIEELEENVKEMEKLKQELEEIKKMLQAK